MPHVLLLLLLVAPTETITGKVVAVKDGDTLVVLQDRQQVTVRLDGVDTPETGQPFGTRAKQAAAELAFAKTVTVQVSGQDRYGRTLGVVLLPSGESLNQELVRQGYAWWYRKYSRDKNLERLEQEARRQKRGLWADPQPVAPWEWRSSKKTPPTPPLGEIAVTPNGVSIVALLPDPQGQDAGHEQVTIQNATRRPVELTGWVLRDRAGNEFVLSGVMEAGKPLAVIMSQPTMPLNNDGDEVLLLDAGGTARSRVSYTAGQVRGGEVIRFGS